MDFEESTARANFSLKFLIRLDCVVTSPDFQKCFSVCFFFLENSKIWTEWTFPISSVFIFRNIIDSNVNILLTRSTVYRHLVLVAKRIVKGVINSKTIVWLNRFFFLRFYVYFYINKSLNDRSNLIHLLHALSFLFIYCMSEKANKQWNG